MHQYKKYFLERIFAIRSFGGLLCLNSFVISKSDVHHTNTIKCGTMVIHTYCHPYMKESCLNFAFKSDRSTKMCVIWENSVVQNYQWNRTLLKKPTLSRKCVFFHTIVPIRTIHSKRMMDEDRVSPRISDLLIEAAHSIGVLREWCNHKFQCPCSKNVTSYS